MKETNPGGEPGLRSLQPIVRAVGVAIVEPGGREDVQLGGPIGEELDLRRARRRPHIHRRTLSEPSLGADDPIFGRRA